MSFPENPPLWFAQRRVAARERFAAEGLPTSGLEAWRHTNIEPIRRTPFMPAPRPATPAGAERVRAILDGSDHRDGFPDTRMIFINGYAVPVTNGSAPGAPAFTFRPVADVLSTPGEAGALEPFLANHTPFPENPFVLWNTAAFADGGCIRVPEGVNVTEPVCLAFLSEGHGGPWVSHPRNLIVAGEASRITIVEVYAGAPGPRLTNAVTEIVAGSGAAVDYCRVVLESPDAFHVASTTVRLDRDASFTSQSIVMGGAIVRHDLQVALAGPGAACSLNGLFVAGAEQLVDNHTWVDHGKPHTASREVYKGILAGRSRGVFNGAIIVENAAVKTSARQQSRNLLLSDGARVHTKPELEIHADDVQCSHGATIGQIDEDALFYLRSRAIGEQAAREMLIRGFASEILDHLTVPGVRNRMNALLSGWFRKLREE